MKTLTKTMALTSAILCFSGINSLYACSTCGCSSKKAEPKECAGGVCSLSEAPKSEEKKQDHQISTLELKSYVDSGTAILLDARSVKYDDGFRIPGAKSLNSSSTAEEIASVIPSKDALIITYCSNLQCPASQRLADHLKKLGYSNVKEYPEGIAGWREAGGQVEKAK